MFLSPCYNHVCVYVSLCACVRVCVCACVRWCAHASIHTHIQCVCGVACVHACTCVYAYTPGVSSTPIMIYFAVVFPRWDVLQWNWCEAELQASVHTVPSKWKLTLPYVSVSITCASPFPPPPPLAFVSTHGLLQVSAKNLVPQAFNILGELQIVSAQD